MNRLIFALLLTVPSAPALAAKAQRTGTVGVELRAASGTALTAAGEVFSAVQGQLLRTYPSAAAGRVAETALKDLVAAAVARQLEVVLHPEWDTIHLPNTSFDTRNPPPFLDEPITSYLNGNGLFVLQFDSPLAEEDRQKLEIHNLQYISYFNYNAVLVAGNQKDLEFMAADDHVVWSLVFRAGFKARPLPERPPASESQYLIQTAAVNSTATRDRIFARAIGPVSTYSAGNYLNFVARFSQAAIDDLLKDPYVIAVEQNASAPMSYVMLPLFTRALSGAYGSFWETTFSAYNAGTQNAFYQPLHITFPQAGFPSFAAGGGYRFAGDPADSRSRIFWVERDRLPDFRFSLRFRDQSRHSQSAGIDLPVVRESEFAERVTLVDVPIHADFRHSLRIYDPRPSDRMVRIRISPFVGAQGGIESGNALVDTTLMLKGDSAAESVMWTRAAEAAIHNLTNVYPQLAQVGSVRIDIDPVEAGARLWAFVAITNNSTQEVTTVTPQ